MDAEGSGASLFPLRGINTAAKHSEEGSKMVFLVLHIHEYLTDIYMTMTIDSVLRHILYGSKARTLITMPPAPRPRLDSHSGMTVIIFHWGEEKMQEQ